MQKAYETASLVNSGNFASKPINKRGVDFETLSTTQPFDGSVNGGFRESTEGGATFKLKMPNETLKQKSKESSLSNHPRTEEKVLLTNEALQEICDKYNLSRNQCYQIKSQFTSMCKMS